MAVERARPEGIVHELTAIPPALDPRKFEEQFQLTNRLRTEGTDHLLAAARSSWSAPVHSPELRRLAVCADGSHSKSGGRSTGSESAGGVSRDIKSHSPSGVRRSSSQWNRGPGITLRGFLRSRNAIGENGAVVEQVRHRRFPIIGGGTGVWSFIHIDDAARATAAGIEGGAPGIYNIVDDEPAPVAEWLPALAALWRKTAAAVTGLARPPGHRRARSGNDDGRPGALRTKSEARTGWQPQWASGATDSDADSQTAARLRVSRSRPSRNRNVCVLKYTTPSMAALFPKTRASRMRLTYWRSFG